MIELEPKKRFLKDEVATRGMLEVTHSAAFIHAAEVALAEFAMRQPRPEGLEAACRAHYELIGARKFLDILLNLGEPEGPAQNRNAPENLIWTQPSLHHKADQPK